MAERLGVIGLGKLGACLAAVLAANHDVIGYDVNPAPVDAINTGRAPVDEPGLAELVALRVRDDDPALMAQVIEHLSAPVERASAVMPVPMTFHPHSLRATTDITEAARAEVAFIVVPTPSEPDGRFSNEYVLDAVGALADEWRGTPEGVHTVVLVSTVMPGSCAGPIKAALDGTGAALAYSPLFVALGSVIHDMTHPDVILLGADDSDAADVVEPILVGMTERGDGICEHDIDADSCSLCGGIIRDRTRVHRMSLVEAELAKLSLNVALATKIATGNEVAYIAERIGADAAKVLAAVGNDSRIGPALLQPGPTAAGPCLGRDLEAFRSLGAGEHVRVSTFVAYGAHQAHKVEPQRVLDRLTWMANGENPVIGILGIAYKPGSAVADASIGSRVAERALRRALFVYVHDPKARPDIAGAVWRETAQDVADAADVILLATPWPEYRTLDFRGKPVLDLWGIAPKAPGVHRFGDGTS